MTHTSPVSSQNPIPPTTEGTFSLPNPSTTFHNNSTVTASGALGKYNYYQALELPNFASVEQVKAAYRELAKRWHPDFHLENNTLAQIAEERFKAINMAYVTLKSPETKSLYDEKLHLLLDKIARYIEKKEIQQKNNTNPTVPIAAPAKNTQNTTKDKQLVEAVEGAKKMATPIPLKKEVPQPHHTNKSIRLTSPVSETSENSTTNTHNNPTESAVSTTTKHLKQTQHQATIKPTPAEVLLIQPQIIQPKNLSEESLIPTPTVVQVKKEIVSTTITDPKTTTTKPMPHVDFLTQLRQYLQPTGQPVVLCYSKEKSTIEVEGILTITPQQAKAGKSIRVQLDASHCEKFNLPPIIQVQLPKNLEEGHRLKITEDKWYNNQTDTAKIVSLPEVDTQQALILVVHIQTKPNSLLSMMSDTLNRMRPKHKLPIDSEAIRPTATTQTLSSNTVSLDRLTNPTVLSEFIQIPLPLAVLGGSYEFTSQVTQEKISINIPCGINNNTHLHIGLTPDTLLDICVTWQLPENHTLSTQEKHLYETLLLTALTTEKRNQQPAENTPNNESPLEVPL